MVQDPDRAPESPAGRRWWQAAWHRVRRHPVLTLLAVLALWLAIEVASIPWFAVLRLRTENPEETALMRQRIEEAAAEGEELTIAHTWVPLRSLPRHFLDAVVVAEDGTFYRHGGIEWYEVWESVRRNVEERRIVRGASSITQQLAKNLYLSTDQTPLRKLKELAITLLLERALSKDRILELYVNVIEWGPGLFGVGAAARRYFGRPASRLSLDEAVRLAAVIPSPLRHRPDRDSRYMRFHSRVIRERMRARGMLREPPAPAIELPLGLPPAPFVPEDATPGKDTLQ